MPSHNQKQTLFWSLVVGVFLIVFLFWLPGFIKNIGTIASSVGSQTRESSGAIEDTVTPQIEELKNTFDTLLEQLPTEESPQSSAPSPGELQDDTTPVSNSGLPIPNTPEQEQPVVTPEQYCRGQGGIHQLRQGGKNGSYAICIFTDGSECEQNMFQKGECKKGQTQTAEDLML